MKILGISCSPRKQGNTVFVLNEALQGAKQEGAEIELYSIADKDLKPCDGCRDCFKTGQCGIKDDMQALYEKMLAANGIIFAVPLYFYNMAAQGKIVMDRLNALGKPERSLANKVGAGISVGGGLGAASALKDLYFFMVTQQMVPANFVAAYALNEGDAKGLPNGLKAAHEQGQQMVHIAKQGFKYPAQFRRSSFAYGTWNK